MTGLTYEFGYKGKDGFRRNLYGKIPEIKAWVSQYGPVDIYTSFFGYLSEDIETCDLAGGLYFDIDCENNLEAAYEDLLALLAFLHNQGIPRESYHVWFSGAKGFHVTIPFDVMGIEPTADLPKVYKEIALELNNYLPNKSIDLKVYERKRLWRIPNSINSKTGLYKIQLLAIPELSEILELAKTKHNVHLIKAQPSKVLPLFVERARQQIQAASKPKFNPQNYVSREIGPEADRVLKEGVSSGNRNQTCFWLACYLRSKGYSQFEVTDQLIAWGNRCNPPASTNHSDFNSAAIEKTVQSAFRERPSI